MALLMLFTVALVPVSAARAYVTNLPASLAPEILSETVPTAFEVYPLTSEDYSVEWAGEGGAPLPPGLSARLLHGTVQWVRVADVLSIPRARLALRLESGEAARATNAGFSQAFAPQSEGALTAEIPVALISGEQNPIEVAFRRGGREYRARAILRFRPRAELGPDRVFYDPSCSRFGMRATGTAQSAGARGWAYVGCRIAEVENTANRTSSLEAWVFWDGIGQSIRIGGVDTPSSSVSVWPLRLRADPGRIELAAVDEMTLDYVTPSNFHRGFLGLGIGPYAHRFTGNGDFVSIVSPFLTLYGSYFVTEAMRFAAFNATTLDASMTTDTGLYLNTEYIKFLDRRVVINLLLGAHVIGFRSGGDYHLKFSVPQGAEITYVDAFRKGSNLTFGFFVYPKIAGVSYHNLWVRWGSPKFFWEFNYLGWSETFGPSTVESDAGGISIGFPVARFL